MDPKRVKYSPATFLSLERQYLSSLVQGRYSDILPVSYRGQPLTLWGQFQSSFPASSSVQMRVDEGRILQSRSMLNAPSVYICGCDLCEATTNTEVTYFHSIMDDMLLMPTPEPRRFETNVSAFLPQSVYTTMATVERVVHVYEDYAMIHEVDVVMPQTPMYSIVRMRNADVEDDEYHKKRQNDYLALMKMTPTRLVF